MGRQTPHFLQKLPGCRRGIVHPVDHGILKGDPPGGSLIVPAAGGNQFLHRICPVHRHNRIPHRIVGGMEGDGQGQLQLLFRQGVDLRHQPAGGKADMAHGDVKAQGAVYILQKF